MQRNKAILPSFILCLPFLLSPVHLHNLIYFQPMPVSTLALSYTPWLFSDKTKRTFGSSKTAKTHGNCCDTTSCHAKSTVPGMYRLPVRLVLSKAVSSRVLQSWNLYKPNEWPWNKWAIRLEIERIFTCSVDYDKTGTHGIWKVVCFMQFCKFLSLTFCPQLLRWSPSPSMLEMDLWSWQCSQLRP